jgi:hypothetical protein
MSEHQTDWNPTGLSTGHVISLDTSDLAISGYCAMNGYPLETALNPAVRRLPWKLKRALQAMDRSGIYGQGLRPRQRKRLDHYFMADRLWRRA